MKIKTIRTKTFATDFSLIISELNRHSLTVMIYLFLISGILIGSLNIACNNQLFEIFSYLYQQQSSFSLEFLCKLILMLIMLTINFIMGLSCVGKPIIWLSNFLIGIFSGSLITTILRLFQNIRIFSFSTIIFVIILVITDIYSSSISCILSQHISQKILFNNKEKCDLKNYLKGFLFFMLIVLISSFLTSII